MMQNMKKNLLVYGSWKIRHGEPLLPTETGLKLYDVPAPVKVNDHSIFIDARQGLVPFGQVVGDRILWLDKPGPVEVGVNLNEHDIPLGWVEISDAGCRVTHLLTRLELQVSHFLKPAVIADGAATGLSVLKMLTQAYERNYIPLNNFECYYIKGIPDTELEQKFDIEGAYNYHTVNVLWYEELASGKIPGFVPQLGDEIQHWAYDNDFYRILPNPEGEAGYVSIMHWSRKRKLDAATPVQSAWNDPVVTFKKKLYVTDAMERWERNYAEQRIVGSPEETLAKFFKLPLKRLPSWRRTRYDLACESTRSGNVFMINFEDSRVWNDSSAAGRLQQCETEYLKTRGTPNLEAIYEDFHRLNECVEAFMRRHGIGYRKSNYSKLTFLEDYVRQLTADATTTVDA